MNRQLGIISIFLLNALYSCNSDNKFSEVTKTLIDSTTVKEQKFPEVKNLSEFKKTQFLPTLEHKISNDKNSIYCATLLFAWEEVRKQLNSPLKIADIYKDLNLLNNSTSFIDVLKSNEYNVSSKVDRDLISARAEFNKSLPFEVKLHSFKDVLIFKGQKVASFGITGHDDYESKGQVEIIYYKNDNDFIIKLLPKEKKYEMILFKTDKNFNSLAEMANEIEKLKEIGKTEKKNEKTNWKYFCNGYDEVVIPKFNFNIETNYSSIEGNIFNVNNEKHIIVEAWQRTAFILDESGAEIESISGMAAAAECVNEIEKPKPKKMFFDKPFLILLKRTDAKHPYFGLWTTNTELMIKE